MAYQPTTNFGWAMPRGGDQAQISVINQQFTAKADEIVYQTRRMIAPGYIDDGTKTYHEGDIVEYENVDYVCTGTTSGAWDSSKWDATDMATQIQEAKESGGTDVEANPSAPATADLHKLKVDTTVYGIPDPTVTKTATGNPIEFTDGADAPLVKCVTEIQGSQDLHGYDKPWVGGAGKNKISDGTDTTNGYEAGKRLGADGTTQSNQNYNISEYFDIKASTQYLYCAYPLTSGGIVSVCFYDDNKQYIDGVSIGNGNTSVTTLSNAKYCRATYQSATNPTYKIMLCEGTTRPSAWQPYSNICPITAYTEGEIVVRGKDILTGIEQGVINRSGSKTTSSIRVRTKDRLSVKPTTYYLSGATSESKTLRLSYQLWSSGTWGTNDNLYDSGWVGNDIAITISQNCYLTFVASYSDDSNILPSEVSVELLETNAKTTHTTTFPSAIYRGSEDCVKGKVTATYKKYTPTSWTRNSDHEFYTYFASSEINTGTRRPCISDKFRAWDGTESTSTYSICFINADGALRINTVDAYSSASDMMTAIGDISFVCDLATPTTSSVTPTNLPIKSLLGYNHIESSTGDMEIEYITQTYQPLVDLIDDAAEQVKDSYSTTEHVVGKWVDGSDVYEKEIITEFNNAAPQYTLDLSSIGGVSTMPIFVSHSVLEAMEGSTPIKQIIMPAYSNSTYSSISVQHQSSAVTGNAYITVRYIKLTSNNRSLSKGPSEEVTEEKQEVKVEEPIEEKKEEVKEENVGEDKTDNEEK